MHPTVRLNMPVMEAVNAETSPSLVETDEMLTRGELATGSRKSPLTAGLNWK